MTAQARLPTYRTAARVLEGEKGSGTALLGWTVARIAMIAPPFVVVGVPVRQALTGAALSSVLISMFTVLRLFDAKQRLALSGPHATRRARRSPPSRR